MAAPKPHLDLRCYLVTGDSSRAMDIARQAVAGGCGTVQVRSKPIEARALYELAAAIARELGHKATILIDDRVDIALALRHEGLAIHGVHLGQSDLPVPAARALLGPDAIIGLTTGALELVEAANEHACLLDYLGAGPFRPTPTKDSGRPPLGLAGYPPLVAASQLPIVAIGDIGSEDASALATTGVAGVAISRALMNAPDPAAYAAATLAGFTAGANR